MSLPWWRRRYLSLGTHWKHLAIFSALRAHSNFTIFLRFSERSAQNQISRPASCLGSTLWYHLVKFKKMKNAKSAQTIAPVDEFKGSPGWKKHTQPWKNASNCASSFQEKSMKNRAPERVKPHSWRKCIKTRSLGPLFQPRIDFWSIFGSPRVPKNC